MVRETYTEGVNATEGLHTVLTYVNDVTGGMFVPLMLFAIFFVVMMGTYYSAKRLSGDGNFPASFAVAGFMTTGASFIMMLIPGLINTITVVLTLTISVVGVLWLFFSNR